MSSKIEIDRDALLAAANQLSNWGKTVTAAPLWEVLAAPVVERQPVVWVDPAVLKFPENEKQWVRIAGSLAENRTNGYTLPLFAAPPDLAELQAGEPDPSSWPSLKAAYDEAQAAIARLTAERDQYSRMYDSASGALCSIGVVLNVEEEEQSVSACLEAIERLKGGQGEAVAWMALNRDGFPEKCLKSDPEGFPVYRSQPAPVSVVLPERKEYPDAPEQESYDDIHSCGEVYGWNACLDKVKELNQ